MKEEKQKAKSLSWTLKSLALTDIKEFEKNPRWLTQKNKSDLKKSLDKFGMIDKPCVNLDMTLIGGHQRMNILLEQGLTHVDCWVPNRMLTAKEVEELNIRLNKNGGSFDFDILANQFDCQELLAWGFDEKELLGELGEFTQSSQDETEEEATKSSKEKTCPECGHKFK